VVRSLLKVKGINTNFGSMRGSDGNITRMTPLFLASQNNDFISEVLLEIETKRKNERVLITCIKL